MSHMDLPPLDRALAVLGPERVDKRADGTYLLDGIPVAHAEIIAAANKKLIWNGQPPIHYPGVWPKPDPQRPQIRPEPEPDTPTVPQKVQRVGRWSFLSPAAQAGGVVTPPIEELDDLSAALTRLQAQGTYEAWADANALVDVAFRAVCQFMRDRNPRRAQKPEAPAKGEA